MKSEIHNSDVLKWCEEYDGEKFHAMLCDPPYELGFMGRDWDRTGIAFKPETWAALGEHLHPGAFCFAFASTRGVHRMACAIEDAGFILHPTVFLYSFGCLSEDTEILTEDGWEPYHKATQGTGVMCYDKDSNELAFMPVQELVVYDYDETAYHIHSDETDQIVSRNHRCIVERDGHFEFRWAETLQRQEAVPILAGLPDLQHSVLRGEQRPIPQEELLQSIMQQCSNQPVEVGKALRAKQSTPENDARRTQGRFGNVRTLRSFGVEICFRNPHRHKGLLQSFVSRKDDQRSNSDSQQIRPHRQEVSRDWTVGRGKSCVERWRDLLSQAWQLQADKIHTLSGRVLANGAQRWVRDGTPDYCGSSHGASAAPHRSGASHQPRPTGQPHRESATVRQQPRPQATRTSRRPATTLAEVTPVHYTGKVWCVKVPTGAFVARRNGKIFITGNSGFPKATRIDTQIDRAAGAEREVVGQKKQTGAKFRIAQELIDNGGFNDPSRQGYEVTEPATDLAKAWQGHRYGRQSLKPAVEPVICFSKPPICYTELQETVDDISLLLEDLWTRFASSAEAITKAELIVATVLTNAEQSNVSNAEPTTASDVGGSSSVDSPKPKKAAEPTAPTSARTPKQASGSLATTAKSLSINVHMSCETTRPGTVHLHATQSTAKNCEPEIANSAENNSSRHVPTGLPSTVQPSAATNPDDAPCSKTHCATATATDTRPDILRFNSERAKCDLSTIWLWRIIWDDACERANKCITGTELKTITTFKTLNSSLRKLMLSSRGIASEKSSFDKLWPVAANVNESLHGLLDFLTVCESSARFAKASSSVEPIICFQLPYTKGRKPVDCITETGAGALNIDASRIASPDLEGASRIHDGASYEGVHEGYQRKNKSSLVNKTDWHPQVNGRWPANFCVDEFAAARLDLQSGVGLTGSEVYGRGDLNFDTLRGHNDTGGASRFFFNTDWNYEVAERLAESEPVFYTGKASRRERNAGCEENENNHPTVKPIALSKWLSTLLLPPIEYSERRLLVPFSGVGSEMIGASLAGWEVVQGIEQSAEYVEIARARLRHHTGLFADAA